MLPLPLRIAIYARYSSDIQSPTSIEDQIKVCRAFIERTFHTTPYEVTVFEDAALSGATMHRAGVQKLIQYVQGEQIDVVVAEGIDRISRSIADMAIFFDLLANSRVRLLTIHEGEVSDLHVGMKGTMNKLFLKDLKERIRRGQLGRMQEGYVMSAAPFGYRTVRGVVDEKGRTVNGVRAIDPEKAEIVRTVFTLYAEGKSAIGIARELNSLGFGKYRRSKHGWTEDNIREILENPFYIGKIVRQRTRRQRDPLTGKIKVIKLPPDEWISVQIEDLRIIPDPLWQAVQLLRRRMVPRAKPTKPKKDFASHQRVLTDYVFCGACGSVKHVANSGRYVCSGNRYTKSCSNSRGRTEADARAALFEALAKAIAKLPPLRPTLIRLFEEDTRKHYRLDQQQAEVQAKIDRLMAAVEDGVDLKNAIERIKELQKQKRQLQKTINFAPPPIIPKEVDLKKAIRSAIGTLRTEPEREPVREMLAALKPKVIMTPIVGRYHGETITVELPTATEPWVRFWLALQGPTIRKVASLITVP